MRANSVVLFLANHDIFSHERIQFGTAIMRKQKQKRQRGIQNKSPHDLCLVAGGANE